MGFVLKTVNEFTWPIKLKTPGDGAYKEESLNVKFKKLKVSELEQQLEKFKASRKFSEFCKEVVLGWDGLTDEAGNKIEFSPENLNRLLDESGLGEQIFDQYFDVMNRVNEKN